ncbi:MULTISPECIES: methylmalonyl Co-A mutase-associated GTPase MeaB [unclassified Spirosoma]|uniref:methylmalonyl Co-A mutase-associated GTPase MeaB n=1 Tax=unclassified Spirosoma TaxID=2621999 RepID=UPI000964DBF4|nr:MULTISPECIES: methylmalonyl Co-A mutase-associated GTPase MeaB [unclassified Spirosoma]MBN8823598.1 methylmalonyl Co-A mutase-associated GTPase MeaB [Spirosoma sp.]OJW76842.1 MAG: ATPase/protein kinase [Spirosoma sp. 48-14]
MRQRLLAHQYIEGILAGDRLLLSRAITLVESRRPDDQALAQQVLEAVLPATGQSIRVGITGVPGVGKSTFIEGFGQYLTNLGHRLAVLTIDPTSQRSGGSLLGDKTRMETLSMNPSAYIRPSPAGDSLGGVAHRTRETILLCEAAGFDIILVETVGVGQSETVVHGMVDFFLLLMLAGAGDELQGMKRGIMELADALCITKADGDNRSAANRAQVEYQNALHLFPPTGTGWFPPVLTCSAITHEGLAGIWQTIQEHQQLTTTNGHWRQRRQEQQRTWFRSLLRQRLESQFYAQPGMGQQIAAMEEQVLAGNRLPAPAVDALLANR